MRHGHIQSGGRYPVLRAIAILYVIVGGVIAVGGIGTAIYELISGHLATDIGDRLAVCGWVLVATFVSVITMLALSEIIKLFMDVERNTRLGSHNPGAASVENGVAIGERPSVRTEESAEGALFRGH